jgi:hypothetical protein
MTAQFQSAVRRVALNIRLPSLADGRSTIGVDWEGGSDASFSFAVAWLPGPRIRRRSFRPLDATSPIAVATVSDTR